MSNVLLAVSGDVLGSNLIEFAIKNRTLCRLGF